MKLALENVSIIYKTGNIKNIGIKDYIIDSLRGQKFSDDFLALENVSFSLVQGDMLGIIGGNGAGKSTLLKVITGIMQPSSGKIAVEGRIAALLELASGFDANMTVKENVFLRGAILGYDEKFLRSKYDDIIEFSGLKDFQNTPFKQLSSGMKSRLGFSISSMVDAEILILDEVLSVGDAAFRKKSEAKMKSILQGGVTAILVSHSLDQIRRLCNKVLWLEKGKQVLFGSAELLCDLYEEFVNEELSLEECVDFYKSQKEHIPLKKINSIYMKYLDRKPDSKERRRIFTTGMNEGALRRRIRGSAEYKEKNSLKAIETSVPATSDMIYSLYYPFIDDEGVIEERVKKHISNKDSLEDVKKCIWQDKEIMESIRARVKQ